MAVKFYDLMIRVSEMGERDEEDDTTMTVRGQRASGRHAIEARGGRVGREFKLLDQSGWTVYQSPEWQEAVRRCRDGESAGFAIAYDDRLGRNWRKAGRFYDEAEEAGAEILFANLPGVDYRSDDGRTLTGILSVVAERTSLTAKKRGRDTVDAMLERNVPNRCPYGYRRNQLEEDGPLEDPTRDARSLMPDEDSDERAGTANVVRRIYRWRADGWLWADVVRALEAEAIPSPSGKHWTHSGVASLVACEMYLGTIRQGKRPDGSKRVKENAHAPLVGLSDWMASQPKQHRKRSGNLKNGLAGGLMLCSGCGESMSVVHGKYRDELRLSYGCRRQSGNGKCPKPVAVSKPKADNFVDALMRDLLSQRNHRVGKAGRNVNVLRQARKDAEAELAAYLAKAKASAPGFEEGQAQREQELEAAELAYADAAASAEDAAFLPSPEGWENLDLEHQNRLARQQLIGVVVSPPLSRSKTADATLRFSVRWKGTTDDSLAGSDALAGSDGPEDQVRELVA